MLSSFKGMQILDSAQKELIMLTEEFRLSLDRGHVTQDWLEQR